MPRPILNRCSHVMQLLESAGTPFKLLPELGAGGFRSSTGSGLTVQACLQAACLPAGCLPGLLPCLYRLTGCLHMLAA